MPGRTNLDRTAVKLKNLLSTDNRLTRDRSEKGEIRRKSRTWEIMIPYFRGPKEEWAERFTALMRALDLAVTYPMLTACDERAIHLAGDYSPVVERMEEVLAMHRETFTRDELSEITRKGRAAWAAQAAAQKNPDQAVGYAAHLNAFREAAEAARNSVTYSALYGFALSNTGDYAGAIQWLQESIRCNGLSASAHALLARVHRAHKCYAAAMQAYHHALVLQPFTWTYALDAGECLQDMGDLAGSVPYLQHAARVGHDSVRTHWSLARTLLKLKRPGESLISARHGVQVMPSCYEAQTMLGTVLWHLHRWSEARTAFEQALFLKPNDVFALRWLGGTYLNEGRPEQAVEMLREAVSLAPDDAHCRSTLVWALSCAEEMRDETPKQPLEDAEWSQRASKAFGRYAELVGPQQRRTSPRRCPKKTYN